MAVLGLLLLLSAAGLTLDVVVQNSASINVDVLGQTFSVSPGWLFAAGAAAGAVGLLGVILVVGGVRRARRRRVALADSRGTVQALRSDRDRLAAELDQERADRTSTSATPLQPRGAPLDGTSGEPGDLASTVPSSNSDPAALPGGGEPVAVGRHGLLHRREHAAPSRT
jgi:hypothetical protein